MGFLVILAFYLVAPSSLQASELTQKNWQQMLDISESLRDFRQDCGQYPSTKEGLESLIRANHVENCHSWNGPYLRKLPKDPFGRAYIYENHPGQNFVVKSLGADRREGGLGLNSDIYYIYPDSE